MRRRCLSAPETYFNITPSEVKIMKSTLLLIVAGIALSVSSLSAADASDSASDGKHLFILSGQSNMREPMIGTFSGTVKKALGSNQVIVTTYSLPSQPILGWYKKWTPPEGAKKPAGLVGDIYDKLMVVVQKAVKGQRIKSVTYVWMQGEADAEAGYASRYKESFFGVLDQLKADLNIKEINFVIGRINDYWLPERRIVDGEIIRALHVKIAESDKHGAWINTDDLNTGVNPWGSYEIDGGHFPNPGYRVMGLRFARAACTLADPTVKLDETLFAESYPDDARKVKTNLALGKPITGTTPDAKHSGGQSGLAALVDGKFGTPDGNDPAWLAFPPAQTNISFLIDLGKPTDLSSVAINILNDHQSAAHFPSYIDVLISENGADYRHLLSGRSIRVSFDKRARQLNLAPDFKSQATLVFIEKQALAVRYVKVEIAPDAASNSRLFLDEIMVNPVMK
jgi:hypothetical protein